MRRRTPDGRFRHLTYCTNVHPGETPEEIADVLRTAAVPVMRSVFGDGEMSLGLRLGDTAVDALMTDSARADAFDATLRELGARPRTLNVFPQTTFQRDGLKRDVYLPSWSLRSRFSYTLAAARLLAGWLDDGDPFGTLSSVPIGWREGTSSTTAATFLGLAVVELARLEEETGRRIAIALEPEPGCVFDTASDAAAWWNLHLRPEMKRLHLGEAVVARHLGLCYDTCHAGVAFNAPDADARLLSAAGISVHKVQLSSAPVLRFSQPSDLDALLALDEPRFLHQTRIRAAAHPDATSEHADSGSAARETSGSSLSVLAFDDLPDVRAARDRGELPTSGEARCHFHVPIHIERTPRFGTTRSTLIDALAAFPDVQHLEVETYTFDVLPPDLKVGGLPAMIAAELRFADSVIDRRPNRSVPG